jgi:hypothetical protein
MILEGLCQYAVDLNCFSHTLDHVGDHVCTPEADTFISTLLQLQGQSQLAKVIWRSVCGKMPPSVSPTRWWSRFEFAAIVLGNWNAIDQYITALLDKDCCTVLTTALRASIDSGKKEKVFLQLRVVTAVMLPFVKATYNLEGDEFLAPFAYDCLSTLSNICNDPAAVLMQANVPVEDESLACIKPALKYFVRRMADDCAARMTALKCAVLWNPTRVRHRKLEDVRLLPRVFNWPEITSPTCLDGLLSEWNAYQALAATFTFPPNSSTSEQANYLWNWWGDQRASLPTWCKLASLFALLQPSSATAERVYSIVRRKFSSRQLRANMPYIEGAVMLEYNNRPQKIRAPYNNLTVQDTGSDSEDQSV